MNKDPLYIWYMELDNTNLRACVIANSEEKAFEKLSEAVEHDSEDKVAWKCFDVVLFEGINQVACFSQGGRFYIPNKDLADLQIQ